MTDRNCLELMEPELEEGLEAYREMAADALKRLTGDPTKLLEMRYRSFQSQDLMKLPDFKSRMAFAGTTWAVAKLLSERADSVSRACRGRNPAAQKCSSTAPGTAGGHPQQRAACSWGGAQGSRAHGNFPGAAG